MINIMSINDRFSAFITFALLITFEQYAQNSRHADPSVDDFTLLLL